MLSVVDFYRASVHIEMYLRDILRYLSSPFNREGGGRAKIADLLHACSYCMLGGVILGALFFRPPYIVLYRAVGCVSIASCFSCSVAAKSAHRKAAKQARLQNAQYRRGETLHG